ncbi:MAG TPA: hypothetical protein VEW46_10720 [Pyrinomonadaceae bacterium]|nr:hypothetical protein [Pyrinomonadaceae bacterium]
MTDREHADPQMDLAALISAATEQRMLERLPKTMAEGTGLEPA